MSLINYLEKTEPLWLFVVLITGLVIEFHSNYMLRKEYQYDKEKDERRQRKTRTTKKVTTEPSGTIVTEEFTESTESKGETKNA